MQVVKQGTEIFENKIKVFTKKRTNFYIQGNFIMCANVSLGDIWNGNENNVLTICLNNSY